MTMILPPANPRPQPSEPLHADGPETAGKGDAFAEILAMGVGRLPGPAPIPGHGPEIVAVPPEWLDALPPAAAAVAFADPESREISEQAQRFNQDGFFGCMKPMGERAAKEAIATVLPLRPGADVSVAPVKVVEIDRSRGDIILSRGASGVPTGRAGMVALPIIDVGGGRAAPLAAPSIMLPEQGEETFEASAAPARRPLRARLSGQASVHVVLRELEQGLHVAARVDGLEESDRERLHEEIVGLLARHGLSARQVAIAAPTRVANHERMK